FAAALGLVLLLLLVGGGYVYRDYAAHFETTDDAYIASRQFSVAPKVAGYITAVPVTDNQRVKAGDVIARIDDRDYRTALAQAEGAVSAAQSGITNIDAQMKVQQAQVAASQAQLTQAKAALTFAQQQAQRYQKLAQRGAGTLQNQQQYDAQLQQQQAAVQSAEAAIKVAERQSGALQAQRATAVAKLTQAQAQLDQAKLNLSYTVIKAAQPGRVVNLTAAVGQYVQPGTALTMFVPEKVWVAANFKETQLDHMRPGQPAMVTIDAYPDRQFHGHVVSIQPGSGTAFSLLPAENATGNFVKVVQRVPVKIALDNPPSNLPLGPGMSVEPTVRINAAPSIYERLKDWL
ncbi:MAG TPA: HlyD family secretion protein, partial [Pseudolabrys sp.]|nr:HlyD family secretion protein [Pseudolabrys sp.]